jgi:hypothetical protein
MIYFLLLFKILLVMTVLYYAVFFGFVYYWHEKVLTYILAPVVYTFEFFAIGFLVVIAASILLEYVPQLF